MKKIKLSAQVAVCRILLAGLFFVSISTASYSQTVKKELLIGKWTAEKLEFAAGMDKNVSAAEKQQFDDMKVRLNTMTKGLVTFIFTADNKCIQEQKGQKARTGTYHLFGNNDLVYMEDRAQIIQLDKVYLKLYKNETTPVIVFKRQTN